MYCNKNSGHNKAYANVEKKKTNAFYFKRDENFNYLVPSRKRTEITFFVLLQNVGAGCCVYTGWRVIVNHFNNWSRFKYSWSSNWRCTERKTDEKCSGPHLHFTTDRFCYRATFFIPLCTFGVCLHMLRGSFVFATAFNLPAATSSLTVNT